MQRSKMDGLKPSSRDHRQDHLEEPVLEQKSSCLDRNLRVLVPARSRPLAAGGDGVGDVLLQQQEVLFKLKEALGVWTPEVGPGGPT